MAVSKTEFGTVFVTGASGYIAKHTVLQFLQQGTNVIGSVRNGAKAEAVRRAISPHLTAAPTPQGRLDLVTLDLNTEDGWAGAMKGADALIHMASPFPMTTPKDENDLIRPAVDGTLRALRSARAAGIKRVILTSSVAAISFRNPIPDRLTLTEKDWSDASDPMIRAYAKSKTLAERAAWDFVRDHPEMELTTINPCFVIGPALDLDYGTSLGLVQRLLSGRDPAMPRLMFEIVDVRDIARMHVLALANPATIGERLIGSAGSIWFRDLARVMKTAFPDLKIATRTAPDVVIKLLALFDPAIREIVPMLGKEVRTDNSKARAMLGLDFISVQQSALQSAQFLLDNGRAK